MSAVGYFNEAKLWMRVAFDQQNPARNPVPSIALVGACSRGPNGVDAGL